MSSYSDYTDDELVSLLRQGDHSAYTEIFHRYKRLLYLHAYKRLNNREEAREVVQELFTTFWERHPDLHISTRLSAYLYTSVRNRVIKVIAHKQVESAYFTAIGTSMREGYAITDHRIREKELAGIIEKEIDALPPKMRTVFNLSRKEQLSHQEIAGQLNVSRATVKKQVNNALKILRVKLDGFLFLLLSFLFQ